MLLSFLFLSKRVFSEDLLYTRHCSRHRAHSREPEQCTLAIQQPISGLLLASPCPQILGQKVHLTPLCQGSWAERRLRVWPLSAVLSEPTLPDVPCLPLANAESWLCGRCCARCWEDLTEQKRPEFCASEAPILLGEDRPQHTDYKLVLPQCLLVEGLLS